MIRKYYDAWTAGDEGGGLSNEELKAILLERDKHRIAGLIEQVLKYQFPDMTDINIITGEDGMLTIKATTSHSNEEVQEFLKQFNFEKDK